MTPEEYNAQLQSLQNKRAIANAMLTQSMASGKDWGQDRFQHSPLEVLANLGSNYFNGQNVKRADADIQAASKTRQAEIADALSQYESATPDNQEGAQALQNIRAAPDGELAKPVLTRSALLPKLMRTAIGPDKTAEMVAAQAMQPEKLTEVAPGGSLYSQKQGKTIFTNPKETEPKPLDELAKLNDDLANKRISQADYDKRKVLMTTRPPPASAATTQGFDDPNIQALQAAFTTAGVSPPSGFRSQAQQLSMFRGLLARNPGKSPDEIVAGVRTGQLDFNGAKRSTGQIAQVAAVTDAASRQLEKNFAAMEPLVSKMGETGTPILDRALAQLRNNFNSGGDKDTAKFITYLRAVAGEYAKIKSSSTGAAAPAEGEMKDALEVMQNAFSTGGYQGIKEALLTEAANKRASYQEGLQNAAQRSTASSAPPSSATDVPDDIAALLKKHGGK